MTKYIIVTDKPESVKPQANSEVLTPADFISNRFKKNHGSKKYQSKVINLCNNFDYLCKGYYVSLLAEARGLSCVPHISNIVTLNWKRNYEFALPELNTLLKKYFLSPGEEPLARTYTTFFGRHEDEKLEPITRHLFDLFRFPVLTFSIKYTEKGWTIERVDSGAINNMSSQRLEIFHNALAKFTGSAWRLSSKNKKVERYWIAILHDPEEAMPPSDKGALNKFIRIGKQMGLWIEIITKQDFSTLLEYDALFIRETTAINNHTYRFAAKAEHEDIPCIDDTQSIIRCCNKVFLHELLHSHAVPVPKTYVIDRHSKKTFFDTISFPVVIKIPDGSFSRGIHKAENFKQLEEYSTEMLKKSEIVLCQEFIESEFDWRIGILDKQPLFALQYFMAKGHWQIYNHQARSKAQKIGNHQTVPLNKVPSEVMEAAIKAAGLIGKGLYGVDLKQTRNGEVFVIEVNDNPNIDSGIEDALVGDSLYQKILEHMVKMIES